MIIIMIRSASDKFCIRLEGFLGPWIFKSKIMLRDIGPPAPRSEENTHAHWFGFGVSLSDGVDEQCLENIRVLIRTMTRKLTTGPEGKAGFLFVHGRKSSDRNRVENKTIIS